MRRRGGNITGDCITGETAALQGTRRGGCASRREPPGRSSPRPARAEPSSLSLPPCLISATGAAGSKRPSLSPCRKSWASSSVTCLQFRPAGQSRDRPDGSKPGAEAARMKNLLLQPRHHGQHTPRVTLPVWRIVGAANPAGPLSPAPQAQVAATHPYSPGQPGTRAGGLSLWRHRLHQRRRPGLCRQHDL